MAEKVTTICIAKFISLITGLPCAMPARSQGQDFRIPVAVGRLTSNREQHICRLFSSSTINVTAARLFCPDMICHLPLTPNAGHRTNSNKNNQQRRLIYWTIDCCTYV